MARPAKIGLDYFPFDVDFHDDDKVGLIVAEFGVIGEAILIRLLCKIYKSGYFYRWGDDERLLFCKWAGGIFVPSQVSEVINGCLRRSLFDKRVFEVFGILTSRGIQKRFLQASKERKEIEINADYWLLDIPNDDRFIVNRPNNPINPPDNPVNLPINPQRKEKKRKVKKNKDSDAAVAAERIEQRIQKFHDSLVPYVAEFGKEIIREFYDYWSEPNQSKTKMRFELEKTWDTPRRLNTWRSRKKENYGSKKNVGVSSASDEQFAASIAAGYARAKFERENGDS